MESFKKECNQITEDIKKSTDIPIFDGVINPKEYIKTFPKILWILKESNSEEKKSWSFIDCFSNSNWLLKHNNLASIRRVIYVSHGILDPNITTWKDMPWSTESICHESVKKIAYINIKKHPGGNTANDNIIRQAAISNYSLLKKQIEIYKPNIVILGNTLKYFDDNLIDLFGEDIGNYQISNLNNHYYQTQNRLYINAYHPSIRGKGFTDAKYVMDIVKICKDWLKKENTTGNTS